MVLALQLMPCAVVPAVLAAGARTAPSFSLKDARGASVRLAAYRGRVVLLDFWSTTCGGCKVEIPWYMELQKKYKGSGLVTIGVSMMTMVGRW